MAQEEWLAHSREWRRGYNSCMSYEWTGEKPEKIESMDSRSEEWKDGYLYALHNTGAYTTDATTGSER